MSKNAAVFGRSYPTRESLGVRSLDVCLQALLDAALSGELAVLARLK